MSDHSLCHESALQALSLVDAPIELCDKDGRIIFCTRAMERYGLRDEAILGKTPMYLVEQGYADKTALPSVLKTRHPARIEQKTRSGACYAVSVYPHLNKNGEIDFIVQSFHSIRELQELKAHLHAAELDAERCRLEIKALKASVPVAGSSAGPCSDPMRTLPDRLARASHSDITILLLGESGTGKTHLAREIHAQGPRKNKPFVSINCSTISPNLFESELFGYAAGAFTGADAKGKNGLVALADGGTLFLDEIGDVPLPLQVKLLELIQEKRYLPVGALRYKSADLKIIAATNHDLGEMVHRGEFREDLYYRLKVADFSIPPLRERPDEFEYFLSYFLNLYNNEYGCRKQFHPDTKPLLTKHRWPGNVRELQNMVHNLVVMAPREEIHAEDVAELLSGNRDAVPAEAAPIGNYEALMTSYEKSLVEQYFSRTQSSRKMAKALQISQTKANKLIQKYISRD